MMGMGWPELLVVGIVAVFVFGPDRLPELARQAGSFLRMARQMVDNAKTDLAEELGPEFKDLNLRDLDPRELVRRNVLEAMDSDEPEPRVPSGKRPLKYGERPPFDAEAT
jgi:sec-independent protein translocase protein TatB